MKDMRQNQKSKKRVRQDELLTFSLQFSSWLFTCGTFHWLYIAWHRKITSLRVTTSAPSVWVREKKKRERTFVRGKNKNSTILKDTEDVCVCVYICCFHSWCSTEISREQVLNVQHTIFLYLALATVSSFLFHLIGPARSLFMSSVSNFCSSSSRPYQLSYRLLLVHECI